VRRKIIVATIDAGGMDYLDAAPIPNIRELMKGGFVTQGSSVLPSVTNVNNVSIVTGRYPAQHGINSNYWYRPETGEGVYMESPDFVIGDNVFQRAAAAGLRSALLTSKDKLKRMLEPGSDLSISAEYPTAEYQEIIGPAQPVYSAAINHWLYRALQHLVRDGSFDLIYVSTTDYIMHKFPPAHEEAMLHLQGIDTILGQIMDQFPETEIYITADHGMNQKTKALDLKRILAREGLSVEFVPVIKDRYVVHHDNLGGFCYLYLLGDVSSAKERGALAERATELLRTQPGVDAVYARAEAAARFHLLEERIGDLVVLATRDVVFGELEVETQDVDIRSHGSVYESKVPIIGYNSPNNRGAYRENIDVVRNLHLGA
jgi:phosphonoacetate hydrolase